MNEISVAISVIGFLCSISSIVFAYLALKRNEKNDTKIDGERFGLIQADIKYIVKTLWKKSLLCLIISIEKCLKD